MNSSEFDQRFDEGESVLEALDLNAARRPKLEQLDQEASRLGVTRQSIIKVWLAERLERRADLSETRMSLS